eukprot:9036554-Karenia_brevis.AAC.1
MECVAWKRGTNARRLGLASKRRSIAARLISLYALRTSIRIATQSGCSSNKERTPKTTKLMPLGVPTATCCGQKWSARPGRKSVIREELIALRMHSPTPIGRTSGASPSA